jgi:hypothetical protein
MSEPTAIKIKPTHSVEECRSCGDTKRCLLWTVETHDVTIHGEGQSDIDGEQTTGLCDACLEDYGTDDLCVVPEEDHRTGVDD